MNVERKCYSTHKNNAKHRNIEYMLTFEEWSTIWKDSGKWEQRGRATDQFVLGRLDNSKPFSVDNCVVRTQSENMSASSKGKPKSANTKRLMALAKLGTSHTDLHNKRISDSQIEAAKVKLTCEHCGTKATRQQYGRVHGNKCKQKPA